MIIDKYGKIQPKNEYTGKKVTCRTCGTRCIIQSEDNVKSSDEGRSCYNSFRSHAVAVKFECPFCNRKTSVGDIYDSNFDEWVYKHEKIGGFIDGVRYIGSGWIVIFVILCLIGGLIWLGVVEIKGDRYKQTNYRYSIYVSQLDGHNDRHYYANEYHYDENGNFIFHNVVVRNGSIRVEENERWREAHGNDE